MDCVDEMLRDGVQAKLSTLTSLLVACSHQGLLASDSAVVQGHGGRYQVYPTHGLLLASIIDLLEPASYPDEAEEVPFSVRSDDVGLTASMNACISYGDVEQAMRCFDQLVT